MMTSKYYSNCIVIKEGDSLELKKQSLIFKSNVAPNVHQNITAGRESRLSGCIVKVCFYDGENTYLLSNIIAHFVFDLGFRIKTLTHHVPETKTRFLQRSIS